MPFDPDDWQFGATGNEHGMDYTDIGDGVRVYDARFLHVDAFPQFSPIEKIGYAVHHAVTRLPNGSVEDDKALIGAIWNHHVNTNGWGGIGYHRIIGAGRRIYLVGGSSSQRAHVANLNHQWIGWCFLGNWTNTRPTEDMMTAFRRGTQWETDKRQVPMLLRPHKGLNPDGTECPGGWAAADAWAGVTLQPQPIVPPQPVPPTPPPTPSLKQQILALVNQLPD